MSKWEFEGTGTTLHEVIQSHANFKLSELSFLNLISLLIDEETTSTRMLDHYSAFLLSIFLTLFFYITTKLMS